MHKTSMPDTDVRYGHGIQILDEFRLAAISTLRPDGWPQTTLIRYANDGFKVYFYIDRSSQKYVNIVRDNRVSIAVGEEPIDPLDQQALFASARAYEVTEPEEWALALKLLRERYWFLPQSKAPDDQVAIMCANCEHVSLLNRYHDLQPGDALTIDHSVP